MSLDNKIQVMTGTYVFPDARDIKRGSGENKYHASGLSLSHFRNYLEDMLLKFSFH